MGIYGYEWTDEQIEDMKNMSKNGASVVGVAKKYNVSSDAIKRIAISKNFISNFKKVNSGVYFTLDDIKVLKEMMHTHTTVEIADKLGKHRHFVEVKVNSFLKKELEQKAPENSQRKYKGKLNLTREEIKEFLISCSKKIVEPKHETRRYKHESYHTWS